MNIILRLQVFLMCLALSACASKPQTELHKTGAKQDHHEALFTNEEMVKKLLYQQHATWEGVNYKLGGLSQSGVDCSGFVYKTYRDKFGIHLPRTTQHQAQLGKKISKSQLRPGDLVFFKTGIKTRHVGIYIGSGRFLHASSTKGVTISQLNEQYWKNKYWHARRLPASL